jgi:hypothetical protein
MRNSKGRFLPGPDPDRHDFSDEERRRGWLATWERAQEEHPEWLLWLRDKVRRTSRRRKQ